MNFLLSNPKVESFIKWWLSELTDMLPNAKSLPVKSGQQGLDIYLNEKSYQFKWQHQEHVQSVAGTFLSEPALASYKKSVQENSKLSAESCNVFLHEKMILNRIVTLPIAVEENIDNVIAYEIDRYTPFKREDVYFDAQVQSRNKAEQKITVLLRVIKRSAVHELLEFAHDSKIDVGNIYCVDENSVVIGEPLKLNDIQSASARNDKNGSTNKYLFVLAAVLSVIALCLPIAKNYWNAQNYMAQIESINDEIVEVKSLLSTYREMKKNIDLSASLNMNATKVTVLLNDLTLIIPDDTSLNRLTIEDSTVRMQGTSQSASKLISILDSTQKFTGVKFAASVTQSSTSGKENFTIEMQIKTPENSNAVVE